MGSFAVLQALVGLIPLIWLNHLWLNLKLHPRLGDQIQTSWAVETVRQASMLLRHVGEPGIERVFGRRRWRGRGFTDQSSPEHIQELPEGGVVMSWTDRIEENAGAQGLLKVFGV